MNNKLAVYKKAIDAVRPFKDDTLRELREYYRIGLTYSSNAIEGNSLTEVETKVLLEDGLTVGGKPLREMYEAVGHSAAYDYMLTLTESKSITVNDIKTLHRLFYHNIDEKHAGVWRDIPVIVTGTDYVFPLPKELPRLMDELEEWITDNRDKMHPIEFAAMLHLKFVTIHPFVDGNGRVARLLMNTSLIGDGFLLAIVPPILRTEYISAIRAYQKKKNAVPFTEFISERVLESYREISRLLHIPVNE
jgi:Fic family protein